MIVSETKWRPQVGGSGRAKYARLAQAIRDGIVSGDLQPGEKLPPVRDLAFRVSMTPGTVARAYSILIDEGRLSAQVGRGTFVKERGQRPKMVNGPVMLDPFVSTQSGAHLLSPKVPDVGQVALIRRCLADVAQETAPEDLLGYPTRQSDAPARAAFAASLMKDRVGKLTADDIVVSNGGQSAIGMILQTVLHGSQPVIAVDALSYGGFRSAGMLTRAQVVSVPWDDDGPIPEAFEALIKEKGVQAYCTSAEVTNPTVRATTPIRRTALAEIARRYGVHIIDDDCYRLMRTAHLGPSYRKLLPDLGWYVTSPSKTLTPAMRIGFAVGPQSWSHALVRTATYQSFGVTRMMTDLYARVMAEPSLAEIIESVKERLALDISAAQIALQGYDVTASPDVPFFWLRLPRGWRASAFCDAAKAQGVLIKPAEDFADRDGQQVHAVRIATNGWITHETFAQAMGKLRDLLSQPGTQISI